jgi:metal-responsive CopG/Arc/MetJ family transcriptional regulator
MDSAKKHSRRRPKVPIPVRAPKKIVVDFPEPLFRETEIVVAELSTTRSNFIRLAVEAYLRERRQKMLEEQLIAGYTANAQVAREIAEEMAQFD